MINICPNCKGVIGDTTVCPKCGVNILDYKEGNSSQNTEKSALTSVNIESKTVDAPTSNVNQTYIHIPQYNEIPLNENRTKRHKPQYHLRFLTGISVFCILVGIALVIVGFCIHIPEKHINTYMTFGSEFEGEKYTEYVGGDAYNIMIEASLRGGLISGRTAAKAIYITGGCIIFVAGLVFASVPVKR